MDFRIDFKYVGNGDAIIVWGREPNNADYVFFIDGGNAGDGAAVVKHYEDWIKPFLYQKRFIGFVNSHPHADHINGLLEIIDSIGSEMNFGIFNDPVECITEEHKEKIYKAYLNNEDDDITHLYKSFKKVDNLISLCTKYNITRFKAFTGQDFIGNGSFLILSPSEDYYANLVQYFSNVDFLKTVNYSTKSTKEVNELDEDLKPCAIVDEENETSPENLSSTVIQLIDSKGKKYILTSDAGVDAFDYMDGVTFEASNISVVQLPHHGSRRNVNANWLSKFNPSYFIVSAIGSQKHPRKAVINCIKRNKKDCNVYSTHTNKGCLSITTNKEVFPNRNWNSATPL
jgi:beta-lactamase superfamily II metal-dependent hydrolase